MKRNFGIYFACGLFVLAVWVMGQQRIYRPPRWQGGTPKLLEANPRGMRALFTVSEPAVIYWRIYPETHPAPPFGVFTDTNVEGVVAYGGGFAEREGSYTNRAKGLNPDQSYVLYAVAVPRSAAFWGEVKALAFRTPKSVDAKESQP